MNLMNLMNTNLSIKNNNIQGVSVDGYYINNHISLMKNLNFWSFLKKDLTCVG